MRSDSTRSAFVICVLLGAFLSGSAFVGCLLVPLIEPDAQGRGRHVAERSVSRGTVTSPVQKIPTPKVDRTQLRVQNLMSSLRDGNTVSRTHAAFWLGELGQEATAAVPLLSQTVLHDQSRWVRRASAKALGKIQTTETVRPLVRALGDRDKWVSHSAANALRSHPDKEAQRALSKHRGS